MLFLGIWLPSFCTIASKSILKAHIVQMNFFFVEIRISSRIVVLVFCFFAYREPASLFIRALSIDFEFSFVPIVGMTFTARIIYAHSNQVRSVRSYCFFFLCSPVRLTTLSLLTLRIRQIIHTVIM